MLGETGSLWVFPISQFCIQSTHYILLIELKLLSKVQIVHKYSRRSHISHPSGGYCQAHWEVPGCEEIVLGSQLYILKTEVFSGLVWCRHVI